MSNKKRGRPRDLGPIADKLNAIMQRLGIYKEHICVKADIRYPTLENVWKRKKVSKMTLKSLKFAGLIDDKDLKSYHRWIERKGL